MNWCLIVLVTRALVRRVCSVRRLHGANSLRKIGDMVVFAVRTQLEKRLFQIEQVFSVLATRSFALIDLLCNLLRI